MRYYQNALSPDLVFDLKYLVRNCRLENRVKSHLHYVHTKKFWLEIACGVSIFRVIDQTNQYKSSFCWIIITFVGMLTARLATRLKRTFKISSLRN